MLNNQSRSAVSAVLRDLRGSKKGPRVNLVSVVPTSNAGYARVTASVVHTAESRENPALALQSLSELVGGKVRTVPGSFHSLSSSSVGETITGIVSANPEVVAFDENDGQFKAVAGNMFMDEEEQLWALRKTEAGNLLVKSRGKEDADILADMMTSLSSSSIGSLAFEAHASVNRDEHIRSGLEGGDFISFVNPNTEQVEFGAIVASVFDDRGKDLNLLYVQSSAGSEPVQIDRALALGVFDGVEFDDTGLADFSAESSAGQSLDFIASYYQRVFQRDPSYFEKFMQRWMNHSFC